MLEYRALRVKDYETRNKTDYIVNELLRDIDYNKGLFIETGREWIAGSFWTLIEWYDGICVEEARDMIKDYERTYGIMDE